MLSMAVDIGFRPDNMLIATVSTAERTDDRQTSTRCSRSVRERLQTVPGVVAVSYAG